MDIKNFFSIIIKTKKLFRQSALNAKRILAVTGLVKKVLVILSKWCTMESNMVKFMYSEKATKILRNLPLTFDYSTYGQKLGEDFAKFCGLLRIYEL